MTDVLGENTRRLALDAPELQKKRYWRYLQDRVTRVLVALGGWSVLFAILMIFLYLLYEIAPLFGSAQVQLRKVLPAPAGEVVFLAVEEQGEVGLRINRAGDLDFFSTITGEILLSQRLPLSDGDSLVAVQPAAVESRLLAAATSSGQLFVLRHSYSARFDGNGRRMSPGIEFPFGDGVFANFDEGISALGISESEDRLLIAIAAANRVTVVPFEKRESLLQESVQLAALQRQYFTLGNAPESLQIDGEQRWLFAQSGHILESLPLDARLGESRVTQLQGSMPVGVLVGGMSLITGGSEGRVQQMFMAGEGTSRRLLPVREFDSGDDDPIALVVPEHRRKGFVTVSATGSVSLFHGTAHRRLFTKQLLESTPLAAAIGPRANILLVEEGGGTIRVLGIDNDYPEISWSALWGAVWYEGYQHPDFVWQSSSSSNDFEPKYSLTPLAFGTLKAAFYAMLLAAPIAICAAIYTAYFMAPFLRKRLKPLVELMEALPTVILGFLAGLWLAPFIESNLAGLFSLLVFVPLGVLVCAYLFTLFPSTLRQRIPEGWEPLALVPLICILSALCLQFSELLELLFFDGDMRSWVTNDLGISFDQRNSLVVGIAMGFAVIPTIFSIAEDAIYSVPRQLSYGSLALGATRWQTLTGVVLPTASPGMFSAVMIGMGRAVGETMIVLMATGNTPIMDFNIFEGMRTLAANIAVEVPEAEVDSSHYRILFLTAFVLFAFTFLVNTVAELVRQRLRRRYGML